MKTKKKLLVGIASGAAILGLVAGCGQNTTTKASSSSTGSSSKSSSQGSSSSSGVKNTAFTYWYPWGGGSQKFELWRIGQFQKKYPNVKINSVYVPPHAGISNGKLLAAIAGHKAPSLVIADQYQPAYALAIKGALEPIGPLLKKLNFNESAILPSFKSLMNYNGKTYLLPETSNVNLLYYNKTMFENAGLKPPKTWNELNADAAKLTKISASGQIERAGFIPWTDAGNGPYLWGWIFGATYFNQKTHKIDINSKQMVNMYDWMDSYAKKYNPTKIKSFTSGFGGAFSPNHPFFNGKIAMTVNGNWFAEAIKEYAPKLKYGVVPIPAPPGGRKDASTFATNVFMIPKGAKHPLEALKFAIFASSGSIAASDINEWRSFAVNQSSHAGVKWYNNGKITDPIYKAVMKVAKSPNSGSPALTSVGLQMGNDLTHIRDQVIYNNAQPGPLLAKLQKKLQGEVVK